MIDFEGALRVLTSAGVDFILVGGVAATVHGSTRLTLDLDLVYGRAGGDHPRRDEDLSRRCRTVIAGNARPRA